MPTQPITAAEQRKLLALRQEIDHWERQGVHSLTKLSDLIELMLNEGRSMSEVAGKTGTNRYNQLMQAVLDLGIGRAGQRDTATQPKLVTTVNDPENGRMKRIKITAKGRRLKQRLLSISG
jgi:hypothetical protein